LVEAVEVEVKTLLLIQEVAEVEELVLWVGFQHLHQ
jgi:hypothetical protein